MVTLTKSACAFTAAPVRWNDGSGYDECAQWNEAVLDELADLDADVVFSSASAKVEPVDAGDDPTDTLAEGLATQWEKAAPLTERFVAVRDTPVADRDVFECLEENTEDLAECAVTRGAAFPNEDPQVQAASRMEDDVHLLDLTDLFCAEDRCDAVVGNVVVYRDHHHMTSTYSELLSDRLADRMEQVMG